MNHSVPWNKISDFLQDCGKYRNPKELSNRIMLKLDSLIPYDRARLYFLNGNGTVCGQRLLGIDEKDAQLYHSYYSQLDNGAFSVEQRLLALNNRYPRVEECVYDWERYRVHKEFFNSYIRPYHIYHCFGLGLRNTYNSVRSVFSFERTSDVKYSDIEIAIMAHTRPHLDNLFQNLYVPPPDDSTDSKNEMNNTNKLTPREWEVAELLKQGVIPANICKMLYVSPTTVKKHIANIHAKLKVSTRQELVVKLFQL